MKILFIYSFSFTAPSKEKPITTDHTQFGISYISSLLKKHSHQTKLLVLPQFFGEKHKESIDFYIKNFYPKLICFTSVSTEFPFICDVAKYIKNNTLIKLAPQK